MEGVVGPYRVVAEFDMLVVYLTVNRPSGSAVRYRWDETKHGVLGTSDVIAEKIDALGAAWVAANNVPKDVVPPAGLEVV